MKLKVEAKLDKQFMPMSVVYRDFVNEAKENGGEKLIIAILILRWRGLWTISGISNNCTFNQNKISYRVRPSAAIMLS